MKKTLVVMAAGMGSRYGKLKQIDQLGPDGEYLIDYAVYDALTAGFDKIVFIIRPDFAAEFQKHFAREKFGREVEIVYVYQKMDDVPAGFVPPAGRVKPWGTGHAVLAARDVVHEPFAVISADDFYGRAAYQTVADWLEKLPTGSQNRYAVVGYRLGNTLSQNGWVSRGLLKVDEQHCLTSIHEHTKVGWVDGQIVSRDKTDTDHILAPDRLVSMVMFAFTPDIFGYLSKEFEQFVRDSGQDLSREFFTPVVVNDLIQAGTASMEVLPTESAWFGMTYGADRQEAVAQIKRLIGEGVYPAPLWAEA